MKRGLLLLNLGTPEDLSLRSIWRYLATFLSDPRVIQLPFVLRYLLLYGMILPWRVKRTQAAYQEIWLPEGSPLRVYNERLVKALQAKTSSNDVVALGMRYGSPTIQQAVQALAHCDSITVLPLFPQYSSAATGSAIEAALTQIAKLPIHPHIHVIRDFYDHPAFIHATACRIKPYLTNHDHLLLSYHGLPKSHLACASQCEEACPLHDFPPHCYRAQCFATSRAIATALDLSESMYTTAFQSRLGRTPWITPYTDVLLAALVARGVKRLAVACPSFLVDCLETLEEIGIRANHDWQALGGESLTLIPCLNDDAVWVEGILEGLIPPLTPLPNPLPQGERGR